MPQNEPGHSFLFSLFGFTRSRSPRHLIMIVGIHILAWSVLFLLPLLIYPFRINISALLQYEIIDKLMLVVIFYLFYYWLIPRFFEQKRFLWFGLMVIFGFVLYILVLVWSWPKVMIPEGRRLVINGISPSINAVGPDNFPPTSRTQEYYNNKVDFVMPLAPGVGNEFVVNDSSQIPPFARIFAEPGKILGISRPFLMMTLNRFSSSYFLIILMAGFIRLSFSFIRNQNEKKILENAQLNAEVDLLKSQINPHFLFNTLNSIYSQAHARSENTEHSIMKLSELLRYVLYDSGTRDVPLEMDVRYIRNYIELQRLRLSNRIKIDFQVKGDLGQLRIEPMLLISYIENAFKHGISYAQPSTIVIHLAIEYNLLSLKVINPIVDSGKSESNKSGGLGLVNGRRRLELLYPGQHHLLVQQINENYIVQLNLKLAHD